MAEIKLGIRRGFTELPDDEEGRKYLIAERRRLFDGLVNTLDLEVKNRGEIDNLSPPDELVEVIIAFASAGVFTAAVNVFKTWLELDKISCIEIECKKRDGQEIKVKMESASEEQFQAVLRELRPCIEVAQ